MTYQEISPGMYEVPREGSMRVPVRLVAQKHMLEHILSDRTLQQAKNVAALPGILEASYVMPDGHEGYGFPIGGVAAFDEEEGIVSPGGVGYDINCLHGSSNIQTEFGSYRPIEDFEKDFPKAVQNGPYQLSMQRQLQEVASLTGAQVTHQPLMAFMKKQADKRMLRIITKTGKELICSEDHPLRTGNEFKAAGSITPGESLCVRYFKGVPHQTIPNETYQGILAKVLGYFMGDGTLTISGKKMRAAAYGKTEDLEKMADDIGRLGFKATVFERTRNHTIASQYGTKSFKATNTEMHVYAQEFCHKLQDAGMPIGQKTMTHYAVPMWIMKGPQWIQRLFLAGLFGAELTTPRANTKTCFNVPIFAQNKNEMHKESARHFIIQIMHLLEGFGVESSKLAERQESANRKGPVRRFRLEISCEENNLLRLFQTIGFEYSAQKQRMAEIASRYILLKKKELARRSEATERIKEYRKKGLTLSEVQTIISSAAINARFVERAYQTGVKPRISQNFISFKDFTAQCMQEFFQFTTLQDPIESIEEVPYAGWVYDFTVAHTHNFIANGIVVSNCGVRFLRTDLSVADVQPKLTQLTDALFRNVPAGVGTKSKVRFNETTLEPFVTHGLKHAIEQGFGVKKDADHVEENGQMQGADYSKVSDLAKKRGAPQLGTLGSGNHFLEVQKVEKVFDPAIAQAFGIFEGQITVMIHSGSRGFGHQVCDDNLRTSLRAAEKYSIQLPDPELCGTPLDSPEAVDYFGAMKCAVNYAFCNRQFMTHLVRDTMEQVFKKDWEGLGVNPVYDVCHNIAKFEEHRIDGKKRNVCVHRKGATRAFWAGHEKVPAAYRQVGQPVIIPGSMNTSSYLLCGMPGAEKTFASSCHGAGRRMSRHMAIRQFDSRKIEAEMTQKGQVIRATQPRLLSEEAGGAYKNVDDVVGAVEQAGISKIVAKMIPLGVVKG